MYCALAQRQEGGAVAVRLRGIGRMETGNAYMPAFVADYNRRFGVAPRVQAGRDRGGRRLTPRRSGGDPEINPGRHVRHPYARSCRPSAAMAAPEPISQGDISELL